MTIDVLQQAERLFRAGRRRAAIDLLEAYMAQAPGDRQAASVLGRIYVYNSQPDRAAFWLKNALQIGRQASIANANTVLKLTYSDLALDQDDLEFMSSSDSAADEYNFNDEYGLLNEAVGEAPREAIKAHAPEQQQIERPAVDPVKGLPAARPVPVVLGSAGELAEPMSTEDSEVFEDLILSDGLEDFVDVKVDTHAEVDIDWQEYALNEDLIDTTDEDPVEEVTVSRLSTLDRARQVAARLAAEADWSKRQIPVLVEILAVHKCHGKTITALKRLLLEDDVTPAELAIMHDLRLKWGGGGYNRDYCRNEATDGWPNISWQQALRLLRCLNVDNADELILFVDDCFDDWCRDEGLLKAYPKFIYYLDRVIENANGTAFVTAERVAPFVDYSLFNDEDGYYDTWRVHGTQLPHHLQIEGLFRDEEFVS